MNFLQQPLAGLPLWMWLAGAAIAVGIAFYLRRQAAGTTGGTLGQNASAVTSDPNIDPYTGVPYSIESQINPATGLPSYYGGPGVDQPTGTPNNPANPTGTVVTGPRNPTDPVTTPTAKTATVRSPNPSGSTGAYDKSHNGVPFDSAPGQQTGSLVPWGQTVTITGSSVQGPSNLPASIPGGTTKWYPATYNNSTGYISAFDLTGLPPGVGTATGKTQATPYWPVALDLMAASGGM